MSDFFTDREFQEADVLSGGLPKGTYDSCTFRGLDLSGTYLDGRHFMDCVFHECNLSNAHLGGAQWNEVHFEGCKMVGLRFDSCGEYITGLSFERCQLDFSSFAGITIPGTVFMDCSLQEVDFSETDLSGAGFGGSNLSRATFWHSKLERADFTSAIGYALDPEQNQVRKTRFSPEGLAGLLGKYGIIVE